MMNIVLFVCWFYFSPRFVFIKITHVHWERIIITKSCINTVCFGFLFLLLFWFLVFGFVALVSLDCVPHSIMLSIANVHIESILWSHGHLDFLDDFLVGNELEFKVLKETNNNNFGLQFSEVLRWPRGSMTNQWFIPTNHYLHRPSKENRDKKKNKNIPCRCNFLDQ